MFQRNGKATAEAIEYPPGSFVDTGKGYYYIATDDTRYRLTTRRVLKSWHPPRVIVTSESAVERYEVTAKMKFRNGSLINNIADGTLYLISDGKRRHITNPDVLERLGAKWSDVVPVSQAEIELHEEGADLN